MIYDHINAEFYDTYNENENEKLITAGYTPSCSDASSAKLKPPSCTIYQGALMNILDKEFF